jgi:apolipoprotein N-acyltransferase
LLLFLASASGVAVWLACSYPWAGWLGWVATLPLLWAIDRAATRRRALLLCWCAGTVASFGACEWMIGLMMRFAAFPFPVAVTAHVLFSAYQSLVWVLFGYVVRAGRTHLHLPMIAVAPIALVAAQWLVPYLFPYGLELSQARYPSAMQIAATTGRLGVTALLALGSAVLFDLIDPIRPHTRRTALAGAALAAGVLGYGFLHVRTTELARETAPTIRIGIAAPRIPVGMLTKETEFEPTVTGLTRLDQLHAASDALVRAGADLVVWPETSYPWMYRSDRQRDFEAADARTAAAGLARPLLFGTLTTSADRHDQRNSALAITANGAIVGRYDKQVLVPFGEYVPHLVDVRWIHRLALGDAPGLQPGPSSAPVTLAHVGLSSLRLGLLICYEDILTEQIARVASYRPDVLVDLSNDVWFDDPQERWMHLAASVYAPVEQHIALLRAASPDGSAFIDTAGRIRYRSGPSPDAAATATGRARIELAAMLLDVPLESEGTTAYARLGPWFPTLSFVCCVGILLAARNRARRNMRRSRLRSSSEIET